MPHISRVAVVEYNSLVRRGLESLLSGFPGALLVSVVAEPHELAAGLAGRLGPDVIVLGPPPDPGLDLDRVIGSLSELGRVLVVGDFLGGRQVSEALRAGAYGCVSRQTDDEELLGAIGTVAQGGMHISPVLAARLRAELRRPPAASPPTLARREIETLRWLAAGLTHRQIARRMALTETTVSTYVKRIRNKLGVGNKADLTRKALELGLLSGSEARPSVTDGPWDERARPPAA
ncbi:LuxR C-terminal-related transcriptional regulator [Actinacidiphila yeochonensis]|uniref:LuxR C-terminal-related transcriptional regulator n=1 Tax=Actinacidiphila yeochonensis TaxID=89050 RepID=UPI00068DA43A|nr:response regulator transcription factor [Actinacidiphila yeochonensis]